jgi:hypothetical protein
VCARTRGEDRRDLAESGTAALGRVIVESGRCSRLQAARSQDRRCRLRAPGLGIGQCPEPTGQLALIPVARSPGPMKARSRPGVAAISWIAEGRLPTRW